MTVIIVNNASNYVLGQLSHFLIKVKKDVYIGILSKRVIDTLIDEILIKCGASAYVFSSIKRSGKLSVRCINCEDVWSYNDFLLSRH